MEEHQVTCINKPHHHSRHEHITHIGNIKEKWRITVEDAIAKIEKKTDLFFTINKKNDQKCIIQVVRDEPGQRPYLRSHADGVPNDNLLEQDECGADCVIGGLGAGVVSHKPHKPVDLRGGGRYG